MKRFHMSKYHWEKASEGERCKVCGTSKKVEILYYGETKTDSILCMNCMEETAKTMEMKN
ncbi:hypothetical protein COO03_05005 [Bacillus sp. AFS098217]|uniref:hypothetical protein n=1 Tax=Bacillus sp. AFS098217 TaxID=2033868 RepID=UPI000BEB68B1|nr:hypothetical protein [Bacillus sp. AFS098217]PEB54601.1 hypothetical protein COO03_05005 [Bacillus sp. AFS098217]